MADAEQAARPAGDEPQRCGLAAHGGACDEPMAEGADRCVFHLVEQVRRLQTYSQWASEQMDQLRAAHVGQRDGGAAGDDTALPPQDVYAVVMRELDRLATPAGTTAERYLQAESVVRAIDAHRAAAAPRAGAADTASLKAGDTVPVRWLDRAGYHYGTGEINPADGDIRPLRVTLRRRDRRDGMPSADFADSVPRAPVEALLAALDANGAGPHVMAAADDVRRHLNRDT